MIDDDQRIAWRSGLIPGTYRLVDPDRLMGPPPKPAEWSWLVVGERMVEALDVIRRIPAKTRPATFKTIWPEYATEAADEVIQKLEGTFEIGRNVVVRTATSAEVERMEEAVRWPWTYLHGVIPPLEIRAVLAWAGHLRGRTETVRDDRLTPVDELEIIAKGLARDGVVIR